MLLFYKIQIYYQLFKKLSIVFHKEFIVIKKLIKKNFKKLFKSNNNQHLIILQ